MTDHASDCAVHNAPALEPGPCDCGALKPCPFCGGGAGLYGDNMIFCEGDDCTVMMTPEAWNTRHVPAITDEDVERANRAFHNEREYRTSADVEDMRAALTAYEEGRG